MECESECPHVMASEQRQVHLTRPLGDFRRCTCCDDVYELENFRRPAAPVAFGGNQGDNSCSQRSIGTHS
jgi:hypothetical protein